MASSNAVADAVAGTPKHKKIQRKIGSMARLLLKAFFTRISICAMLQERREDFAGLDDIIWI
jgi:hypothetical protein